MKRGQSALEYLVTYGWAILVIVIIAAILWYFGVFNPQKWAADKQCGGFTAFQCLDFVLPASSSTGTIILANKQGVNLNVSEGIACSSTSYNKVLTPNGQFNCSFTISPQGVNGQASDEISISVAYTNLKTGVTHTDTGFVKGKFE